MEVFHFSTLVKLVDCLIELNSFVVVLIIKIDNIFVIEFRNFLNSCFTFPATVAKRMLAPVIVPSIRHCLSFKVLLSSLVNLFADILC